MRRRPRLDFERVNRLKPDTNAVVTLIQARSRTREALEDERLGKGEDPGPLCGMTVGIKDVRCR